MNISNDMVGKMAVCVRAARIAWEQAGERGHELSLTAIAVIAAEFYRKTQETEVLNGLLEPIQHE